MLVLKFHYDKEIRRITINDSNITFDDLTKLARGLFGESLPQQLSFKYTDDEGDLITVSSERELSEAIRIVSDLRILRIFISAEKPSTSNNNNKNGSNTPTSFMEVLEKAVSENPFIKDLINNLEIEVKSVPSDLSGFFQSLGISTPSVNNNANTVNNNNNSKPVHNAICDGCESQIVGNRFKCNECPDYDLCEKCEVNKEKIHGNQHTYRKIEHPSQYTRQCPYLARRECNGNNNQSPCHGGRRGHGFPHPATCDACNERIRGLRFKCKVCPDYDLCEGCYNNNSVKRCGEGHEFNKMTRADYHGHGGHGRYHGFRGGRFICDGCQTEIRGTRFRCTVCTDYDLCETCESKKVHAEHPLNKISPRHCRSIQTPVAVTNINSNENNNNSNNMESTPSTFTPFIINETPKKEEPVQVEKKVETTTPETVIPLMKVVPITPQPVVQQTQTVVPLMKIVPVTPQQSTPSINNNSNPSPSPSTPEPSPFEVKLNQLESMGFNDKKKNIELMVQFKGDMLAVVQALLDN